MTTELQTGATHLSSQQVANAHVLVNDLLNRLGALARLAVVNRTTTAPPALTTSYDRYIIGAGATGAWATHDGKVAVDVGSWLILTPREGWTAWIAAEDCIVVHNGTTWVRDNVSAAITASTTQTQGAATQLVNGVNRITVCANANDAVKLPAAEAGARVAVINRGAQTLQVFPASGDKIDGGAADASTTLATTKVAVFASIDGTDWYKQTGA